MVQPDPRINFCSQDLYYSRSVKSNDSSYVLHGVLTLLQFLHAQNYNFNNQTLAEHNKQAHDKLLHFNTQ